MDRINLRVDEVTKLICRHREESDDVKEPCVWFSLLLLEDFGFHYRQNIDYKILNRLREDELACRTRRSAVISVGVKDAYNLLN